MSNRPVHTGRDEFSTARLPSGDEDDAIVATQPPPHEVLDVAPDASRADVKAAFRERVKNVHPDHNDHEDEDEEFYRVKTAKEAMLE